MINGLTEKKPKLLFNEFLFIVLIRIGVNLNMLVKFERVVALKFESKIFHYMYKGLLYGVI